MQRGEKGLRRVAALTLGAKEVPNVHPAYAIR
jgi:hypothetical protein